MQFTNCFCSDYTRSKYYDFVIDGLHDQWNQLDDGDVLELLETLNHLSTLLDKEKGASGRKDKPEKTNEQQEEIKAKLQQLLKKQRIGILVQKTKSGSRVIIIRDGWNMYHIEGI